MSILALTIPATLLLSALLLWLVVRAVRDGSFDDLEGPAARHHHDDDSSPEREALRAEDAARAGSGAGSR